MNSADLILFSSAVLFSVNYVILLKSTKSFYEEQSTTTVNEIQSEGIATREGSVIIPVVTLTLSM